jgi:hypothetical protein
MIIWCAYHNRSAPQDEPSVLTINVALPEHHAGFLIKELAIIPLPPLTGRPTTCLFLICSFAIDLNLLAKGRSCDFRVEPV